MQRLCVCVSMVIVAVMMSTPGQGHVQRSFMLEGAVVPVRERNLVLLAAGHKREIVSRWLFTTQAPHQFPLEPGVATVREEVLFLAALLCAVGILCGGLSIYTIRWDGNRRHRPRRGAPVVRASLMGILLLTFPASATAEGDPVLVGAGDIVECWLGVVSWFGGATATATLLDHIEGTVFTTGDHVYPKGTAQDFRKCYEPTWGRHKTRTRPTPGNHDYDAPDATPYYAYFGENAGVPGRGYYSYDLGAWHIVALNSTLAAEAGAEQERWLRDDLVAHRTRCTLTYWHHPVFSSGRHGNGHRMQTVWSVLYASGVDVIVNGHDHDYERFAPQAPDGTPDPKRGIREFVVGTGGVHLYGFKTIRPNSEVRNSKTWGVLKLTLQATSYDWEFIPVAGGTFRDAGNAACVP